MKILVVGDNYEQFQDFIRSSAKDRQVPGRIYYRDGSSACFVWKHAPDRARGLEFDQAVFLCELSPADKAFFLSRVR